MEFVDVLVQAIGLLALKKHISYRALKPQFNLDDDALEDLKFEIIHIHGLAVDHEGAMLVWTGGGAVATERSPTLSTSSAEPAPHTPEAERRQLTVMFCDLVDSTQLSQQLDPEDYRAVVRAYQEAAATVIQGYDGYMAQYLGDGLLVYFGYPRAHEDTAQRAVPASLEVITAMQPLNRRLQPQYGAHVAVRIGLHTGPVVIGEMGGGDRHEHLAMGDTPNIASRLQGLARPDTVTLSDTTARLLQDTFVLEELGTHTLKGVAESMPVFQVLGPQDIDGPIEDPHPIGLCSWSDGTRRSGCSGGGGSRVKRDWVRSCW